MTTEVLTEYPRPKNKNHTQMVNVRVEFSFSLSQVYASVPPGEENIANVGKLLIQ